MKNQLVRFDWALKKLLRNKANFEILEGFLSELLNQDVKIEKILESESNKECCDDKYNRVDLLTEIGARDLVLIELQVEGQFDYFHRMLYGSSKLITDYMTSGSDYHLVKKVISINIVYFDLGQGKDYIYRGVTEFTGIHTNDILQLSLFQKKNLPHLRQISTIFPEYYILKVNEFNDYARDTLDEWIYFLKNSEIKDEFQAKGIHKASEELDILKLSKEERREYERYLDDRRVGESSIKTSWLEGHDKGMEEGIEKGLEKGIEKGKLEVARRLIAKGMPIAEAAEIAGVRVDVL
jgi:predicted transposase/invertase (TIGR01784 family)